MKNKFKLRIINDKGDKFATKKDTIFDLPMRLLIVGKTGSGKTSTLVSLLTDDQFYNKDFKGDNIYLFSPMINDYKMEYLVDKKKIPDLNVFTELDEDILKELYDKLTEEYKTAVSLKKKPTNKLIILDDLSFDGSLRKGLYNSVNKVFMNGRKNLISIIVTSQHYTHISPSCRSNSSGMILYTMSDKQLELIADENNYLDTKKDFKKMVRDKCKEKHDMIVINYSNNRGELYLNSDFERIIEEKAD